jgi:hypothetical protein
MKKMINDDDESKIMKDSCDETKKLMRLPYFPLMGLSCDEDESKPRKESCGKHEMTNMRVN